MFTMITPTTGEIDVSSGRISDLLQPLVHATPWDNLYPYYRYALIVSAERRGKRGRGIYRGLLSRQQFEALPPEVLRLVKATLRAAELEAFSCVVSPTRNAKQFQL